MNLLQNRVYPLKMMQYFIQVHAASKTGVKMVDVEA